MEFLSRLDRMANDLLNISAKTEKLQEYPILTEEQLRKRRETEFPWTPDVLDSTNDFRFRKDRFRTLQRHDDV